MQSESTPQASRASHASSASPASPASEPRHEEYQYLDLIRQILKEGECRPDRTGTGTCSIFAPAQLRFSLSRPNDHNTSRPDDPSHHTLILPLLTTKRVFLRAVVAELLWFISGDTSSHTLSAQGVKIWDGNGSRAFLDSAGLSHREEGDLGPVYGFQWRHFGAQYKDARTDYSGQGVDQLASVIHKLRHTPYDRRIILSAWNPADLGKMALPPCHMFAQFYVSFPAAPHGGAERRDEGVDGAGIGTDGSSSSSTEAENKKQSSSSSNNNNNKKGTLHCLLYQRSCDIGLGVPFNIASYALLTHMLAHVCDLVPGTFTHTMGDAHVYRDHVDALQEQIERQPRPFPTLEIAKKDVDEKEKDCRQRSIDGWRPEDFVVRGYEPHKGLAMKMSV